MINIAALLFYLFAGVLLTSALLVVTSRNTVYGVLFLILAFFNAAGLFLLANAEFVAMILVIVYVGAVAVLFLFVVMMLNVEVGKLQKLAAPYLLIGSFVGAILMVELILTSVSWTAAPEAFKASQGPFKVVSTLPNTQALGNLLYTHYFLIFQGAGIILLIAMIGAIVLTLRQRDGVLKQKIRDQVSRQVKDTLRLVDIPTGSGVGPSK